MRLPSHLLVVLAAAAFFPLLGCNGNGGKDANAAAGEPHPAAKELDKALERRPKLADDKNRDDRRNREPKTWIGRAVLGMMKDGEGISSEEQDKLRDYILANDEYLSEHMESPKQAILRANQKPDAPRVQVVPKAPSNSKAAPGKSPEGTSPPDSSKAAPTIP